MHREIHLSTKELESIVMEHYAREGHEPRLVRLFLNQPS